MNKKEIKIAKLDGKIVDVHPATFKKSIYKYFALFEHMADEHNLTLLESELQQIYNIVNNDLDSENQQLRQELIRKNNLLIAKDAKIASMQNACDPLIIEGACSIVFWLYQAVLDNPNCDSFKLTEKCFQDLKRIGEGLHDYQNNKPNPFKDDYFRNLMKL